MSGLSRPRPSPWLSGSMKIFFMCGSAVEEAQYNLEASVRIAADDDFGWDIALKNFAIIATKYAS